MKSRSCLALWKSTPHCHMRLRTGAEARDTILKQIDEAGVSATPFQNEEITIKLLRKHLEDSRAALVNVLSNCERGSKANSEEAV